MSLVSLLCVVLIRAYQWLVRPLLGSNCRFVPGCSDYAIGALRTHGAVHGTVLAGRRILRCNPWVAGGFDPVPPCTRCDPHRTAS